MLYESNDENEKLSKFHVNIYLPKYLLFAIIQTKESNSIFKNSPRFLLGEGIQVLCLIDLAHFWKYNEDSFYFEIENECSFHIFLTFMIDCHKKSVIVFLELVASMHSGIYAEIRGRW